MKLEALIFAAHPDDAEIGMGGTISKMTSEGLDIGIVDFSEAELSTRGTVAERRKETEEASKILGLSIRENLHLPDGKIKQDELLVLEIVRRIRKYQPKIIFAPYLNDRHPDHMGAAASVKEAFFYSGLQKYFTELNGEKQEAYRPEKLYYYMQTYEFSPSFIVDISETFETKMAAIRAYKSQFHDPDSTEPETFISKPGFVRYLESRAGYFGFQIRKDFGEPFYCEEQIEYDIIHSLK